MEGKSGYYKKRVKYTGWLKKVFFLSLYYQNKSLDICLFLWFVYLE